MAGSTTTTPGQSTEAQKPLRRILVADDEHLVAASLSSQIQQMQIEVIGPAANGQLAIDLAKQHAPDLALLDIRMPVLDGLEVAQVLFCQMGIPVIIISAYSDQKYLDATARIGVFGYLLKPVALDDLRATLSAVWSRYQKHQDMRSEITQLKQTLEDRKIVEKAKGLLMQRKGLSEDQAMKMLQKRARDSRRKLVDLAKAILETEDIFQSTD